MRKQLLCSVVSSGPVKWGECLRLWQLEEMGPKEAWLNVVLSYDRIKSVYKYTELQKARENSCVFFEVCNHVYLHKTLN